MGESSDTQAIHAHFCPNFQPIYHEGRRVLIGTRALFREALEADMNTLEEQGKTALLVAFDNVLLGLLAVADTLKEGSAEAVAQLHA